MSTSGPFPVSVEAEPEPDWYFSSRGQCASWIKPAWLAQQQRTLPAHVYARLHENRWVDGVGAFLTAAEVDAIFTGEIPATGGRIFIGLDVGLTKDRTVLSVVRATADGLFVVDGLETWQGKPGTKVDLAEVEETAYQTSKRLPRADLAGPVPGHPDGPASSKSRPAGARVRRDRREPPPTVRARAEGGSRPDAPVHSGVGPQGEGHAGGGNAWGGIS